MASKKKLLQAAAGSAGAGGPLNVEDVFSTTVYQGNNSTNTITNGLDLSGDGGLVWIKNRDQAYKHALFDTERGTTKLLSTDNNLANVTETNSLTSFNNDGFTLNTWGAINANNEYACAWSFRQAPNFFDVVQYTGTGSQQTISHNLNGTVGFMIIKCFSSSGTSWACWHRRFSVNQFIQLNSDNGKGTNSAFFPVAPTSTHFTVGTDGDVNTNGQTYVAYLFAHHNNDGTFGADENLDIIKCGEFVGGGDVYVDLKWEPQWVLTKRYDAAGQNWFIHDSTRGWTVDAQGQYTLEPNNTDTEDLGKDSALMPRGFRSINSTGGGNYIYIAIRKGTRIPEDATKVFDTLTWTGDGSYDRELGTYSIDNLYDAAITKRRSSSGAPSIHYRRARWAGTTVLRGINTNETSTESDNSGFQWPKEEGILKIRPSGDTNYHNISGNTYVSSIWKQSRGFFDVVAYSGNSTSGNAINHNLGVAPEMMWVKRRDLAGDSWYVYHKDLGANNYLNLNGTGGANSGGTFPWNAVHPTDSVFYLDSDATVNSASGAYMAFLFASVDGVSKVGSYSGDGTSGRVIDCGFTSGARYVLIKSVNAAGSWVYWDTERGIVSGDDAALRLSFNGAELSYDDLDPDSSGFIINNQPSLGFNINESGTSFIFYAIA